MGLRRKLKFLWILILLPLLALSGCMGGGGGGDIDQVLKNPLIQIMIGIIVLWLVFRGNKKGG